MPADIIRLIVDCFMGIGERLPLISKVWTMAEQKQVLRDLIQIVMFASQATGSQARPVVQQIATTIQRKNKPPRAQRILRRTQKHSRNEASRRNQVSLLR